MKLDVAAERMPLRLSRGPSETGQRNTDSGWMEFVWRQMRGTLMENVRFKKPGGRSLCAIAIIVVFNIFYIW